MAEEPWFVCDPAPARIRSEDGAIGPWSIHATAEKQEEELWRCPATKELSRRELWILTWRLAGPTVLFTLGGSQAAIWVGGCHDGCVTKRIRSVWASPDELRRYPYPYPPVPLQRVMVTAENGTAVATSVPRRVCTIFRHWLNTEEKCARRHACCNRPPAPCVDPFH
jgi:hypothetical protein